MTALAELSIVIPTYNRTDYINRSIAYWLNAACQVHILDGSAEPLLNHERFAGTNIFYHHLPVSIHERLSKAADFVTTKYAIFLSDDEFFLENGLAKCVETLDNDSSLIACGGRCVGFSVSGNLINGTLQYTSQAGYRIMDTDPIRRMEKHMDPYTPSLIYSVMRIEAWKNATSTLNAKRFPDPGTTEMQFELAASYLGKSKIIPVLMWLRSEENPPHNKNEEIHFSDWWVHPEYVEDHEALLTIMTDSLAGGDMTQYDKLKKGIDKAYTTYAEWCKRHAALYQKNIAKRIIAGIHYKNLTTEFAKRVWVFIKNRFSPLKKQTLHEVCKELEQSNISVNWQEINKVVKLVSDFHSHKAILKDKIIQVG